MIRKSVLKLVLVGAIAMPVPEASARGGLGLHAGLSRGQDQFVAGGQAELGPAIGTAFRSRRLIDGIQGRI